MAAPTLQTSFSLPDGSWTKTVYRASPLFVDVFNTGKDDLIAVAGGAQLVAYAENADGSASPFLSYQVPGGVADIKSTPVVILDPRTGRRDLFAAMGRDENNPGRLEDGRVFGWDLQTGRLLPGFTQGVSTTPLNPTGLTGAYGAITSGDLEGTGVPDLVVTGFSSEVTAIRLDGSILWQWTNDDSILSGAVVADIDRDGKPEVVVGGDSSASPYFQQGGWVNVLSNTGILKWRRQIVGEVTWSSPVVADLNNNGYLDIVIGTGNNFASQGAAGALAAGDNIYAFDPFGNMLPGWPYQTTFAGNPVSHEVLNAPVVADLLQNGQLEVVALDEAGYIHVVQANGQALPGFVGGKAVAPDLLRSQQGDNYGSPTIADVNGDGRPDIIAGAGPFLRAFDSSGNLINIGETTVGAEGLVEGIDIAPAVGNFDGSGGLTIALVSYDPLDPIRPTRPDHVEIYRLPPSTLAPPWPFQRRTLAGDAVQRSTIYDQKYVTQAFNTLLGSQPDAATFQLFDFALNSDTTNLLSTSQMIASTSLVRQSEVGRIYQAFLGHAPNPSALSYWVGYLSSHNYGQMEIQVASSGEFAQRAGGNYGNEVVQLYQAILKRTPSSGEIGYWIGQNLPVASLANVFINSPEGLNDELGAIASPAFGPGSQAFLPADAVASFAYDIHTGAGEEGIISNFLASNGYYAATNFVAGYVQDVYRDVLSRMATPSDVAYWVGSVDNGSVAFGSIAAEILNSTEAREDFVQTQFIGLLGHPTDIGTLASLANYTSREALAITLVGSAEFYAKNGSTPAGFVAAAFLDLGGVTIDPGTINTFVGKIAGGLSRAGVAQQIIYDGSLYFNNTAINQLMYYLPDEAQGVLRSGQLRTTFPNMAVNPDPNLIAFVTGLYAAGASDEQVLSTLLNSPQYYSRVAYYKGLYRSPGIRF